MCHHIHLPNILPIVGANLWASCDRYTSVITQEINLPEALFGILNEVNNIAFISHIGNFGISTNLARYLVESVLIDVGQHDLGCALCLKTSGERASNATSGASDDDFFTFNIHV